MGEVRLIDVLPLLLVMKMCKTLCTKDGLSELLVGRSLEKAVVLLLNAPHNAIIFQ